MCLGFVGLGFLVFGEFVFMVLGGFVGFHMALTENAPSDMGRFINTLFLEC